MAQEVHKFTQKTIQVMKQYYQENLRTVPQGAIFCAKTNHAVITAYKSGKVLFQGKEPEAEAGKWKQESKEVSAKSNKSNVRPSSYNPPSSLFTSSHIGSDEAGTGDYFGPITTAAVYLTEADIPRLKALGVKDSKNLTDPAIRQLAQTIISQDIPYSLLILHNEKYNQLQKQGWTQGKMKAMLHHYAISGLIEKLGDTPFSGILIDQFAEPSVYKKHIGSENQKLHEKTYFMTKAESYSIVVAAASIIARASFVNEMKKLSSDAGLTLPKGASAKVDQAAAKIINENGEETLNKIAKIHFANTQKAKKYM